MVHNLTDSTPILDPFRVVVSSAPNAMLLVDDAGQILLANSEAEQLFGYIQDALVGQSVDILVPQRFRGQHARQLATYFDRPLPRALGKGRDLPAARKDGTEFLAEISLHPVHVGEAALVFCTVIDVTERKQSENRIRLLVEANPNAMVMADRRGRIVLVNCETEKMFGYDREELIDQPVEILVPRRFRDDHPRHRASFFERPTTRVMGAGRDLFGVRKDGSEFPVEIGLSPADTDEGLLVLCAIVDITQRKRAETALIESEANLREALHKVEEQACELREANQSLAQYAYVVSHDIRAPLRAIRNYADFLKEDLEGTLDVEQQEYLDGLAEAVDQSEQLVEDLLLLSRVDRREGEPEPLDMGEFFRDLIHSLQLPPEVEVTFANDWPTVCGDATLVRQIFQNLVLNAVKFNKSSPKQIEVGCSSSEDGHCRLYVSDNGIGIDRRHQEQIFRVFQRLHNSEEYEGTGIGLAIVKKAVSKLGGSIHLESEAGKGSTFFVQLPTKSAAGPLAHGFPRTGR